MNSTTTNIAVPRFSTVLTVGSTWLVAFTIILALHLTKVTSVEEFVSTLIATIGVGFATAIAIKSAIIIWRAEKGADSFTESLPTNRPSLNSRKVKAA
ncbi:MAG: hypothetical protein ACOX87_12960 [Chloroflexota bacterium]|jgi:hypothetical protein